MKGLRQRLARIRALVMDVDGVMTDGGLYWGAKGEVMKRFHVRDGMGIVRLQAAGIRVAIITGLKTPIVRNRAKVLEIRDVYTGIVDKGITLRQFMKRRGLAPARWPTSGTT